MDIRSTIVRRMTTPQGLFMLMCFTVILMVLGSLHYLENPPELVSHGHFDQIDTPATVENIKNRTRSRSEVLGTIEQLNVEKYKNGILSMYPISGSTEGGMLLTFLYALQNDSIAHIWPSEGYFGGCIIDGQWVPHSKVALWDASKIFLLSCILPAHLPGEVEVAVIVDNVTRYADNGTSRFSFVLPDNSDEPMVPLALCTAFTDQALYLREWIVFHTILGVTKFYLYDQGSTDNWQETIEDFIAKGIVVEVRWNFEWVKPSIRLQSIAFWHSINTFGKRTKWMGFIDVDEFLFIPKTAESPNPSIVKFLGSFEEFGGVMVDRINFGPNGHKLRPPGLVIENYTKRTQNKESGQAGKSIVQPKYVSWAGCGGVHTFALREGFLNVDGTKQTRDNGCGIPYKNVVWDPIRINHYWTKSAQDWAERLKRDSNPYPIPADELLQKWSYFDVEDTDILEYVTETEKRMLLL